MEPLSGDDPRRLGPYYLIARLAPDKEDPSAADRLFLARSAGGVRTVLISTPSAELADDAAYRGRFLAEAESARRLGGAWPLARLAPVEISDRAPEPPWSAFPYRPILPLPGVMQMCGGPLPVRTIRALGAALAETLAEIHRAGFTHAGIAPENVFVAGDGPWLGGFGAVRAAGPDGRSRVGLSGLAADALPPEQAAGGRPRPLGDIYALGAVLAYASTGRRLPEVGDLPEELRSIVLPCLASDPAERPVAAALVDGLTRGMRFPLSASVTAEPSGPTPTVLESGSVGPPSAMPVGGPGSTTVDGGLGRAAVLLSSGWLPAPVVVALAEQSAATLASEVEPAEAESALGAPLKEGAPIQGEAPGAPAPISAGRGDTPGAPHAPTHLSGGANVAGSPTRQNAARPSRRALLVGVASGSAGLAIGGGAMWMATAEEDPPPTPAERLAAANHSRRRLAGAPPTPLWRHDIAGGPPTHPPLIWSDKIAVVANDAAVTGIDLRTGKRLWTQDDVRPRGRLLPIGKDLILVPGDGLAALSAETGDIQWWPETFRPGGRTPYAALLAAEGGTVWLAAGRRGSGAADDGLVIAYDLAGLEELWRDPLPVGFDEGYLTEDTLVVRGEMFLAFDRERGTRHWRRSYEGVTAGRPVTTDGRDTLIAAVTNTLRGYGLADGGGSAWSVKAKGETGSGHTADFGAPVVHGEVVYATDGGYAVHALSTATGEVRWQRTYAFAMKTLSGARTPDTAVDPSGRTVLTANDVEVDAFDAEDGALRWRFMDLGAAADKGSVAARRQVAVTDDLAVVTSGRSVYALPLS
ncbi:PQQ-binding-like beta-propeller repeat protein [Streptomyces iranensis]|uniref:Outer membrane protein assembly factor BamB n=1 Tax=Streptomyces iranensis TaxID=576784 RepID=A0A060ZRW0_9ACTN|nr:PQQ-binding-like beta-propeller repeat protein [Streptomyces iranensis]MBP2068768.1 outer membrane protein assembly factor BamB [Streptomyces iranensis]CDR06076.1 serine/threonine protein kinase [Streptomyces iranensis]